MDLMLEPYRKEIVLMEGVNFLSEGMHRGNDPNAQPENTYTDSLNGDIVSLGNNRYAHESLKGTVVSFTVPEYSGLKTFQVIGWYSFADYLIVLLANDDSTLYGEIGRVSLNNNGTGSTYTSLYFHSGLRFTKAHPVGHDQIVGKPENSDIKRIVWTDNYNPLRSMNWADPVFTTQISSGSLVNGSTYMVLTPAGGFITYNAVTYGPEEVAGNIFTANATSTFTSSGGAYIIDYVPLESFNVIPNFAPGSLSFTGYVTGGSNVAATYQYVYQLETDGTNRTNWSYETLPIYLPSNEVPTNQAISYAKQLAVAAGTNTGKGIKLNIDNIDNTTYSKIRIAYRKSTAYGVWSNFTLFYYDEITGTSMDIVHYGNETALATFTLDDVTTPATSLDLVKSITTTKNILFAAGIGLSPDEYVDLSNITIKTIEHLMPSDVLGSDPSSTNTIAAGYALYGHGKSQNASNGNTAAYPYQWYEVASGSVTYNAVVYNTGDFFQGVVGVPTITGTGKAVAVIRIQKYTSPTVDAAGNYKNIRVEDDFLDHKGMIPSHYVKSYWRSETYRFGIMFYSIKGKQNFVLWIGDKQIPEQYKTSTDTEIINSTSGATATIGINMKLSEYDASSPGYTTLRSIGLSFSNIDFSAVAAAYGVSVNDLDTVISGFSIVRVPLDQQVIAQGVLWPTVIDGNDTRVVSANTVGRDKFGAVGGRRPNSYVFYSPDNMNGFEGRPNVLAGDQLQVVQKFAPTSGIDTGWLCVSNHNYYEKFVNEAADIPGTIYENGATCGFVQDRTFNIEHGALGISVTGLPGPLYNQSTCAGFYDNGSGGIGERTTRGSDGLYVFTDTDEVTYPDGFGSHAAGDTHRVLVNWTRSNNNLYGGDSDAIKASHRYIYCGHYQPLDDDFMTYMTGTSDATPSNPAQTKASGIVNNVEVFGGDAFVSLFGWGRMSRDDEPAGPITFSSGAVVPIESNINENWRGITSGQGDTHTTMNRNRFYHVTEAATGLYYLTSSGGYEEGWVIDGLFAGKELSYFFNARPLGFSGTSTDNNIVQYSMAKIDGEIVDSWKVWPIANYQRTDSVYGAITNIKAKGTRLYYWQEKGVGVMPVYEQVVLNTNVGDSLQLGIGDILDRQDEVDYWYGNQHQMSLMDSENTFMWFDFRRKSVIRMSYGGDKIILSLVAGMDSFFQNIFTELEAEAGTTIFNSDNPFSGAGIVSYYDQRLRRGLMCFKLNLTVGSRTIERDFTVMFNETLSKYTGFVSLFYSHIINHNGHLLTTREVRPTIQNSTAYANGDEVVSAVDGWNYICYSAFTSAGSALDPSTDTVHWSTTGRKSQVHVNWRGDICKFHGKVFNSYLELIVRAPGSMTVDNIEVEGNDTRFNEVYVSNKYQSGSDLNIPSSHPDYEYVDGNWYFSVPLASTGARMTGNWIRLKMLVKNYLTIPTISINLVKRIFYIKSSIRRKS